MLLEYERNVIMKQLLTAKENMSQEEAENFLKQIIEENKGDRESIRVFLSKYIDSDSRFNGTSKEIKTERDDFVRTLIIDDNVFDLPEKNNKEFIGEIYDKLGTYGFVDIEDSLFSQEAIEILGKDKVYDLIKYYKVAQKKVNLGHVIDSPEIFKKYQEFREDNRIFEKNQMEVIDNYNTTQEFNKNFDLLSDCMQSELTDEQKRILVVYLKENLPQEKLTELQESISQMTSQEAQLYLKNDIFERVMSGEVVFKGMHGMRLMRYMQEETQEMNDEQKVNYYVTEIFGEKMPDIINSKEDLERFPQIRYNKISQMIEAGDNNAITCLLTGMNFNEYNKKLKFLNNEQMKNAIADFGEENSNFSKILAINKVIELIQELDEEKRKEVLRDINSDLAKEFTQEGSQIANMRQAFNGAEIEVRKLYGKELSTSLSKSKLPQPKMDEENDVQVIKLEGQDFKLLIHGIDVFGSGTGKYENREVGKSYISCSLISEKSIKYIGNNSIVNAEGCFYGFDDIGDNSLLWSNNADMGTGSNELNGLDFSSTYQTRMTTTEQLLDETRDEIRYKETGAEYDRDHNEVAILREYNDKDGQKHVMKPSYIISFSSRRNENLQKLEVEEAKRLGIPIVYIDEEKYKERARQEAIHGQIQQTEDGQTVENVVNVETNVHDELTPRSVKAHDVSIDTLGKIADSVPALKGNEAFKTIVAEMAKEQQKEASTYER